MIDLYAHTNTHTHKHFAAFFYDMDGTLTGVPLLEDYTKGGTIKGASLVGRSHLLPMSGSSMLPVNGSCFNASFSTVGVGGAVCVGLVFRRVWYQMNDPSAWVAKSLCVRPAWTAEVKHCPVSLPCVAYVTMVALHVRKVMVS